MQRLGRRNPLKSKTKHCWIGLDRIERTIRILWHANTKCGRKCGVVGACGACTVKNGWHLAGFSSIICNRCNRWINWVTWIAYHSTQMVKLMDNTWERMCVLCCIPITNIVHNVNIKTIFCWRNIVGYAPWGSCFRVAAILSCR